MRGVRFTHTPAKPADVKKFLKLRATVRGYDEQHKAEFHRLGHKIMVSLANHIGYNREQYDIRHCEGGIAVTGEVILHSDHLYLQLSDIDLGMMWRKVKGRKDYTGEFNRWMRWEQFQDIEQVGASLKQCVDGVSFQIVEPRPH